MLFAIKETVLLSLSFSRVRVMLTVGISPLGPKWFISSVNPHIPAINPIRLGCTVSPAMTLALKVTICSNTTDILCNNFSIIQMLHLLMCDFTGEKLGLPSRIKTQRNTPKAYTTATSWCITSHSHSPPVSQLSTHPQTALLPRPHNNTQAATVLMPTFTNFSSVAYVV